jgi:hypothetical protein
MLKSQCNKKNMKKKIKTDDEIQHFYKIKMRICEDYFETEAVSWLVSSCVYQK